MKVFSFGAVTEIRSFQCQCDIVFKRTIALFTLKFNLVPRSIGVCATYVQTTPNNYDVYYQLNILSLNGH